MSDEKKAEKANPKEAAKVEKAKRLEEKKAGIRKALDERLVALKAKREMIDRKIAAAEAQRKAL